jgi:hypothetical protein
VISSVAPGQQQFGEASRRRDAVVVATVAAEIVRRARAPDAPLLIGIDVLELTDDARRIGGIQPGQRVVDQPIEIVRGRLLKAPIREGRAEPTLR